MTAYQVSSEIYGGFFYQGITLRLVLANDGVELGLEVVRSLMI